MWLQIILSFITLNIRERQKPPQNRFWIFISWSMGTNDTPHTLQEKQFVGLRILKYSVIRAIYLNNVTLIVHFATMDRRDLQCGPQDSTKKPGYLAGWCLPAPKTSYSHAVSQFLHCENGGWIVSDALPHRMPFPSVSSLYCAPKGRGQKPCYQPSIHFL